MRPSPALRFDAVLRFDAPSRFVAAVCLAAAVMLATTPASAVEFRFDAGGVDVAPAQVWAAGDFNGWDVEEFPMAADGTGQ